MERKGTRRCLSGHPFFGLQDNYKIYLHEQIFDLIYYGTFDHDSVYSMPVNLRMFYLKKLIKVKETEKQETDKIKDTDTKDTRPKFLQGPTSK